MVQSIMSQPEAQQQPGMQLQSGKGQQQVPDHYQAAQADAQLQPGLQQQQIPAQYQGSQPQAQQPPNYGHAYDPNFVAPGVASGPQNPAFPNQYYPYGRAAPYPQDKFGDYPENEDGKRAAGCSGCCIAAIVVPIVLLVLAITMCAFVMCALMSTASDTHEIDAA